MEPEPDADQTSVSVLSAPAKGVSHMPLPRPQLTPDQRRKRGRIARLTATDPERAARLRKDFHVERLAQQIEALVEAAPPLTDEQRERLRRLLAPVGGA
jgi:hypothetical protein